MEDFSEPTFNSISCPIFQVVVSWKKLTIAISLKLPSSLINIYWVNEVYISLPGFHIIHIEMHFILGVIKMAEIFRYNKDATYNPNGGKYSEIIKAKDLYKQIFS